MIQKSVLSNYVRCLALSFQKKLISLPFQKSKCMFSPLSEFHIPIILKCSFFHSTTFHTHAHTLFLQIKYSYAQNDKLSAYKTLFHEFETMSVDKFNEVLERIKNDPDEKMKIIDFPNLLKKTFIVRRMLMLMKTISQIKIEKLAELFKIKDITEMERYVVATSIDSGFTIKYDQIDGIVINFKNKYLNFVFLHLL